MASKFGWQFTKTLYPEVFILYGTVYTDSSGDPTNINDGTVLDQNSEFAWIPKGLSSISHPATGVYKLVLDEPWPEILFAQAVKLQPRANATLIGTVDLTGLTLSTLNGQTLKLDADVGSQYTTTFTTPTNIADIATQINAGNAGTSVLASIIGPTAGPQYLKVISTTYGTTSTLECDSSSTADSTLGISNVAAAGRTVKGTMKVLEYNTRGATVTTATADLAAQTIVLLSEDGAGAAIDVVSASFMYEIVLMNQKISR